MTEVTVQRGDVPADRFSIITHDLLRGQLPVPLRAMARCLLLHLLSLPTGWKTTRVALDAAFVEGREAVTTGLRELVGAGYLRQDRQPVARGWVWTWHVTDDPIARPIAAPLPSSSNGASSLVGRGAAVGGASTPVPTSGDGASSLVGTSTGFPSMSPISGNGAFAQLGTSTGFPSTEIPSMKRRRMKPQKDEEENRTTPSPPPRTPRRRRGPDRAVAVAAEEEFWAALPGDRRPGDTLRARAAPDVARLLRTRTPRRLAEEVLADWPTVAVAWPGSLVVARLARLTDHPAAGPIAARVALRAVCGRCDARPDEPAYMRTVADAEGRVRHCPRCHPASMPSAGPGPPE